MRGEDKKILFIAPNQYHKNEAWSKEIKEISNHVNGIVLTSGDISTIYFKNKNYLVTKHNPMFYWMFAFLAYFYSRKFKLYFFEVTPYTTYFTLLAKLVPLRNSIYRINSYSWICPTNEFSNRLNKLINNFNFIFVNDDKCYKEVAKYVPEEKIAIIPPGINLENYRYQSPPSSEGTFNVLFASAPMKPNLYPEIFRWKGLDILLDSAKKLADEGIDIKFYILWRDMYVQEIENMIEERKLANVVLINKTVDVLEYYRKCHITIFPAADVMYSPCFPSTIMESLSVGRPVIVTDVVHISDIIERSESGVICNPTSDSIYISIKKIKENYYRFQSNCRSTAEKHFDIRNRIKSMEKVSFKILGKFDEDILL